MFLTKMTVLLRTVLLLLCRPTLVSSSVQTAAQSSEPGFERFQVDALVFEELAHLLQHVRLGDARANRVEDVCLGHAQLVRHRLGNRVAAMASRGNEYIEQWKSLQPHVRTKIVFQLSEFSACCRSCCFCATKTRSVSQSSRNNES